MFRGCGSRRAYLSAAASAVPDEPPARMPSSLASRRAMLNDSLSLTRTISSTICRLNVLGMKSSPIPSTL